MTYLLPWTSTVSLSVIWPGGRASWTVWSKRTMSPRSWGLRTLWCRRWSGRVSGFVLSPTRARVATPLDTEPGPLPLPHNPAEAPPPPTSGSSGRPHFTSGTPVGPRTNKWLCSFKIKKKSEIFLAAVRHFLFLSNEAGHRTQWGPQGRPQPALQDPERTTIPWRLVSSGCTFYSGRYICRYIFLKHASCLCHVCCFLLNIFNKTKSVCSSLCRHSRDSQQIFHFVYVCTP